MNLDSTSPDFIQIPKDLPEWTAVCSTEASLHNRVADCFSPRFVYVVGTQRLFRCEARPGSYGCCDWIFDRSYAVEVDEWENEFELS